MGPQPCLRPRQTGLRGTTTGRALAGQQVEVPLEDVADAGAVERLHEVVELPQLAPRSLGFDLRAQLAEGETEADESKGSDAPTKGGMDAHGALGTDKIEF